METFDKLYTVEDIANMTMLTSRTIRNYLKDGSLKGRKVGGQWRFTMNDIQNFMDNGNVAESVANEMKQSVLDFIDGVNTDITGEIQVCTIVDLYIDEAAAQEKSAQISELINNVKSESSLKYTYNYNPEDSHGRYNIFASPDFIIEVMKILKA